jgi:hypothetical protein
MEYWCNECNKKEDGIINATISMNQEKQRKMRKKPSKNIKKQKTFTSKLPQIFNQTRKALQNAIQTFNRRPNVKQVLD